MITRPPTILAIDDTPANLMTLGAALQGEFELQIATSGLSGIELALQSLPDLILLDVMMPEVDGFETFRRLAAQPTLKDIPVIFVTALDNFESEVTGLSLGAADYITKPVNVVIARQRIRNLLERERLRKEVQKQAEHLRKLVVAVEQSPASVVITNLDASLEYVNPRFTEVTGYSAAEVLGQNPRILQSGITPKDTYLNMWDTLTHGRPWKGELINRRKNGELYWEEAQIAPVKDAAGTVTHYVAVKSDINARKQLESQNEEALSRLQKIASRVPGVVYQYLLRADGSSCFPFASEAIREIYRVTPEEVREDASRVFSILHPDDIAEVASSIERSARDNSPWVHEYRVKFDDGTVRWLAGNAVPQTQPDGAVLWHGFITDVTQRKQAEAVFHGLFEQSAFLAGILDEKGHLLDVNSTALRYTSATREQLIGQYFPDTPWWDNPQDRANLIEAMNQAYAGKASSCEACHPLPGGSRIDVLFSATPIRLENQTRLAVVGVDITERKALEEYVHQLAFYDSLTGLPNRRLLQDRLTQGIAVSQRTSSHGALLMLDLDNFKTINDTRGHLVGDLLLKEVASRLGSCVREVDTIARFGGDEFVVLLNDLGPDIATAHNRAESVAEKIRECLFEPYLLNVSRGELAPALVEHRCSTSIGGTVFFGNEMTQDDIFKWADAAMYRAKDAGRNAIRFETLHQTGTP